MRLVLLALVGVLMALAPSSALALNKAERKAVDIKKVDGASTATAAYVEIKFRGEIEELLGTRGLRRARLKVKFVPAGDGKATTITESGPTAEPEKLRRGTKGFSKVQRAGRRIAVVVRGLPAVAGKVVVTTLGRRKIDRQRAKLRQLETEEQVELELDRTDATSGRLAVALSDANYKAYATQERIAQAKADGERKKRRKQQAKLAALNLQRAALSDRVETFELWTKIVEKALRSVAKRACNDGVDNDEDSLTDFGFDKDPGCVMPLDNDEGDVSMNITCPSPGDTETVSAALTFVQPNQLERFILSLPPVEPDEPRLQIVDAPVTAASGGPYPIDTGVTQLCNPDFDVFYGYILYTDGLPAGAYGLRVALTIENNGDYPGGSTLPFLLSAGTTR